MEDIAIEEVQEKLPYKGKRRGRKKGSGAPLKFLVEDWYHACETFENLKHKMKQKEFLRSNLSHPSLTPCTQSQAQSFGRMLKKYRAGQLSPLKMKRERSRKYLALELKLIRYVKGRAERYKRDKCGVSWALLRAKLLFWAENMGFEDFKASSGWVDQTLKRHGIERINLHGEATDSMSEEDRIRVMTAWKKEQLLEDNKNSPKCLYNADQSGLFPQRLKVKANETGVGTGIDDGVVFNNSFVTEGKFSKGEMHDMVRNWVDIEDNQEMIDCIVDEESDLVEKGEEIVEQPASSSAVQKVSYLDATGAMSTIDSYISTCASAPEMSRSLSSLRWMLQKDYMSRPRCSPTITNSFSANKV